MKKRDLEKALKKKGARFLEAGSRHDRWESGNGYRFTVPRHQEIPDIMARIILKQADM